MIVLGLLPGIALAVWVAALGSRLGEGSTRLGFLRVASLWAAFAVMLTEGLSIFSAFRPIALLIAWTAVILVGVRLGRRRARLGSGHNPDQPQLDAEPGRPAAGVGWVGLKPMWSSWNAPKRLMAVGSLVILVLTAIVAWFAPPSTWDSLNYRLPRVAHWAQLGAVRHFATGIEIQNNMPPGAEILVAQTYVLSGGDHWVNFVGWFAVVGAAIGVSMLATDLGAGPTGQWAAAVFYLTLPMAIIQASSTATDSVVALWVVCSAAEALRFARGQPANRRPALFGGVAAGLAILTKPTAVAFLAPFVVLAAVRRLTSREVWTSVRMGLLALVPVILLNFGPWSRNLATYGNLIAPAHRIAKHQMNLISPQGWVSNLLRNAALHAGTPSPHINKGITLAVLWAHDIMGVDVNDPRTTVTGVFKVQPPTTNEDKAGNPLHAYLLIVLLVVLASRWRNLSGQFKAYLPAALGSFVLFSALFKWQIFGSRYHLPFFALAAPLAGVALGGVARRGGLTVVIGGLLAASLPWLLAIKSRPMLSGLGETYVESILTEPRTRLYFANGPHLEQPYRQMAQLIRDAGCRRVGLRLAGWQAEYPLWVLLGAPDRPLWIEWLVAGTASASLRPAGFSPCAVICQDCKDAVAYGDLPRAQRIAGFQLFLKAEP